MAPNSTPSRGSTINYSGLAAEQSLARLGYEEAVKQCGRTLQLFEVLDFGNPGERCEKLLATADTHGKPGQADAAHATFHGEAEIVRNLADATQLERVARGSDQEWRDYGRIEEAAIAPLEEALTALGEEDSPLRARLLARLAVALAYSDADKLLAGALSTAEGLEMMRLRNRGGLGAVRRASVATQGVGGWSGVTCSAAAGNENGAAEDSSDGSPSLQVRSSNGAAVCEQNLFQKEGDYWTIAYAGSLFRLRDSVGLHQLACLLRHPAKEIPAVALAAADGGADAPPAHCPEGSSARGPQEGLGDAGPMLDVQARATYKRRVSELREELEEARSFNDIGRAATVQAELEALLRELARAVGLQGRARTASSHGERARVNVTRTIKDALRKISRHHATLGRHLAAAVRTGRFCAYVPGSQMPEWRF
jgi:hypothetical protein